MSAPDGATWRSGYATVCKTVYTSSILVVASITSPQNRSIFPFGHCSPRSARLPDCDHSVPVALLRLLRQRRPDWPVR